MEIKSYFEIVERRKWVIILTSIGLITIVMILARFIPQQFSSTAQLRVITPTGGSSSYVDFNIWYADRLMNTYAELAKSASILDELKQKLNLTTSPNITVSVVPDSELINITTQSADPQLSATISNTLASIVVAHNLSETSSDSGTAYLQQRLASSQKELNQAKNDLQAILGPSSADQARIDSLNKSIDQENQVYVALKNDYEDNKLKNGDLILLNNLSVQMSELLKSINDDQAELEGLNTKLNLNNQQIDVLKGEIDLNEKDISSIQSLLDQTTITDLIKENINVVPIIDPAIPPDTTNSSRLLIYVIGIILSLGIAIALGFFVDLIDDRLVSTKQIRALTQLNQIGKIPSIQSLKKLARSGKINIFSEAIRNLRVNIDRITQARNIKSILFCSASPQEGKTTIITNLAREMASNGKKVILVDTDMSIPTVQKQFNISNEIGFSNYLSGDKLLKEVISKTELCNLQVITSGPLPPDIPVVINMNRLEKLILDLENDYDLVLFDAPAFLATSQVKELVSKVEGVVVVVGRGSARGPKVKEMIEELEEFKPNLVGMVINRAEKDGTYEYYYQRKQAPKPKKSKIENQN